MNFTSFSIPLNSGKSSIASSNDLHSSSGAYIDKWISLSEIEKEVKFIRNSRYKKEFMSRTDSNFALKMLQEVWAKLKTIRNLHIFLFRLNQNIMKIFLIFVLLTK